MTVAMAAAIYFTMRLMRGFSKNNNFCYARKNKMADVK